MKRLVAIGLLVLMLLNITGNYLVFRGFELQQDLTWSDDEVNRSEVIVRIPFAVPYASESNEWMPAQGRYDLEGTTYRIVRQKLAVDAVYLALVADQQTTRIHQEMKKSAEGFGDQQDANSQKAKTAPSFSKEYMSDRIVMVEHTAGWVLNIHLPENSVDLTDGHPRGELLPPRNA